MNISQLDAQNLIFVVDTNVLYKYYNPELHEIDPDRYDDSSHNSIINLFNLYRVIIPQICFVEFAAKMLHIKIDLEDYNNWYRKRIGIFKQLAFLITNPENKRRIELVAPRNTIQAINELTQPIDQNILQILRRSNESRRGRDIPAYYNEPKFLDGMDAVILFTFLHVVETNPDKKTYLVTDDFPLQRGVDMMKRRKKSAPLADFGWLSTYSLNRYA